MTTPWAFPNTITQVAEVENHIPWTDNYYAIKTEDPVYLSTTDDLLHISNRDVNGLRMKTYYLYLTGFSFLTLPGTINGIELELNMKRGGRITDDTIQLRYDGNFIGENKADYKLDNIKTLGGPDDLWDIPTLSPEIVSDASFGVGLRFQSHPSWPHREHPMINYARIRVW